MLWLTEKLFVAQITAKENLDISKMYSFRCVSQNATRGKPLELQG